MLTSNKDLKILLKDAESRGWVFAKGNRHIKGKHPSGQTVTVSLSPSDNRAMMNIRKDLRVTP